MRMTRVAGAECMGCLGHDMCDGAVMHGTYKDRRPEVTCTTRTVQILSRFLSIPRSYKIRLASRQVEVRRLFTPSDMAILDRFRRHGDSSSTAMSSTTTHAEKRHEERSISAKDRFRPRILLMAVLVSMGGFIFGYDTGQISGFLEMDDFLRRFGDTTDPKTGGPAFSNGRSGTIVGLVSSTLTVSHARPKVCIANFQRCILLVSWPMKFLTYLSIY